MAHKFSTDAMKLGCGMVTLLRCAIRDCRREHHGQPPVNFTMHVESLDALRQEFVGPGFYGYEEALMLHGKFEGIPIHLCRCRDVGRADTYITPNHKEIIL